MEWGEGEKMDSIIWLMSANILVWLGLGAYLLWLGLKQRSLRLRLRQWEMMRMEDESNAQRD